MKLTTEKISIYDAENDTAWAIPTRGTSAVVAEVSERWVANVIVTEAVCRELIKVPFLEPIRTEAGYVLSLSALLMKHAAPVWMPLQIGPEAQTCALRVACVDTRDGTPAVWVEQRYSDSIFFKELAKLGFPAVDTNLQVERGRDCYQHRQLNICTRNEMIDLRLIEYPDVPRAQPKAFATEEAFEKYFATGGRSYGPAAKAGRFAMVDLHKLSDNRFELMNQYHGYLRTAWGNWRVDSVYRTRNGLYEWHCQADGNAGVEDRMKPKKMS